MTPGSLTPRTSLPDAARSLRSLPHTVLWKLTLLTAVILAVLLGVLLSAGHRYWRDMLREEIDARLSTVAESRRDLVQMQIALHRQHAALSTNRADFRNLLAGAATVQAPAATRRNAQLLLEQLSSGEPIRVAQLLDAKGRVILSTDPAQLGRDFAADPVFREGLVEPHLGVPQRAGERFEATLAAPVRSVGEPAQTFGVLLMVLDVSPLAEALRDSTGLGQTGEVLLGVREAGQIQYIFSPRGLLETLAVPLADAAAMAAATQGREFFEHSLDYRGEPVLAAGRPVGYAGWGLVAKIDEAEAYAPITRALRYGLGLGAIIAMFGLVAAFGLARHSLRLREQRDYAPPGRDLGKVTRACAFAVLLVGLVGLAGWALKLEPLQSVWPGLASMKPNTALGFVLAGMGLALWQRRGLRLGCATASIVLGGLSLAQDFSGVDFGTDKLLFREALEAAQTAHPGRMSAISAVNFILLGGSLLLLGARRVALRRAVDTLALFAGLLALLALLSHAYGADALYRLPGFGSMTLHTALAFLLLALGVLCAHADGLAAMLAGAGLGGQVARRFLPLAIVAPLVLGWLTQTSEEAGLLNATQDTVVLAAAMIVVMALLVSWNALSLQASDAERTQAETQLREHETLLRTLTAHAHVGMAMLTGNLRYVFVNAAYAEVLGLATTDFIGKSVADVLPLYASQIQHRLERAFASERHAYELVVPSRKDGDVERFFAVTYSAPVPSTHGPCVIVVVVDISERRLAEAALRESEARYREVVESSTIGMAIHQHDSGIVYVNPAFLKMFGYASGEELLGRDYFETLALPEERPLLRERSAVAYRGESIAPHPGWRGVKSDGSPFWLSTTANLIAWQGRPALVSFMTDITERRQAEEEVRLLNRDLEQRVTERTAELARRNLDLVRQSQEIEQARSALEAQAVSLALASKYKSEFLSNMSHELRTPLNSLLILSRLLADNPERNLAPKQVEFAEIMHQSGSDLLRLINEILDLSRIEAGQVEVFVEAVELASLREKVERNFDHVALSNHLEFAVSLDPALPVAISTDPNRLEQVLKNLLANSFKFTQTGSVTLRIGLAAQGWTRPHPILDQAEGVIAFTVTDTGIGIAPEKQQLIFEAFAQADGTTSRKYGGTGLGLSISREIAGLLGGQIALASQPGQGSIFTLYLPFAYPPKAAVPNGRQVEYGHHPGAAFSTVEDDREVIAPGDAVLLMVENDPVFAKLLLDIAHRHAFKGLVATSAAAALRLARVHQPAAITLSVTLPDMDGWKLLQCVNDDLGLRHIPVHIVSGEDERPRGLRQGAASYLQKPVTEAALGALFERIKAAKTRAHAPRLLIVEDDPATQGQILQAFGEGDAIAITRVDSAEQGLEQLRSGRFDCVVLDLRLPGLSGFEFLEAVRDELRIDDLPIVVYTGMDLSSEQQARLRRLAESVLVKDARSLDRLLEQASLYLRCPLASLPAPARTTLERLHVAVHRLDGKKVLVVDDDMRNVYALFAILENARIDADYAKDGKHCLEILQATPDFDAVLMDIMMPGMDGYETMRRMRNMKGLESLPVIALTAKAMKGDREKCIAAGASDYLAKPVEAELLLAQLRFWIHR